VSVFTASDLRLACSPFQPSMVPTNRFERGKLLLKEHLPCRCSQAFWTNLKCCLNLARVAELTEMKLCGVILYIGFQNVAVGHKVGFWWK
jgi:hypothetical protein